jgi:hypothetical protein
MRGLYPTFNTAAAWPGSLLVNIFFVFALICGLAEAHPSLAHHNTRPSPHAETHTGVKLR